MEAQLHLLTSLLAGGLLYQVKTALGNLLNESRMGPKSGLVAAKKQLCACLEMKPRLYLRHYTELLWLNIGFREVQA